jgi:hypothetical protein
MVSAKSLQNLKPFEKGHPGMGGRPPGPTLMTMLRNELQEDGKFQAQSIGTFKKCIINGDARFWQMMIDMLEPEARSRVASMMGVNVNVAANAQAVASLPAPDISALDRMRELAKLFADIPALPEPPTNAKCVPNQVPNVTVHPVG